MENVVDSRESEEDSGLVAVIGGTIIDGNGGAPIEQGVILIDGKRIMAVGDRSLPIPPYSKRIPAHGKFVIPGLTSACLYLLEGIWPPEMIRHEGRYHEVAIEGAQIALKSGITTVFDTWGPRDPLMKARDAINDGSAIGARIYLGGNWLGCGGPYSPDVAEAWAGTVGAAFAARNNALWEENVGESLTRMPVDEARTELRRYMNSGIDFANLLINAHRYGAHQYFIFSPRVQEMVVDEAHRAGHPALAFFVNSEEAIHLALDLGVDAVHLNPWVDDETSAETLALISDSQVPVILQCWPDSEVEWRRQNPSPFFPGGVKYLESLARQHRAVIQAGARIVEGGAMQIGHSVDQLKAWTEIGYTPGALAALGNKHVVGSRALQEKGMTAMEALMAITRNTAQAYKVDRDLGTLEVGKLADVVILERNPLENPQNYLDIHLVMKEGRVIDRGALPTQRLWTAAGTE